MIEMKFDAEFDMSKWLTQVKNKKLRDVTGNCWYSRRGGPPGQYSGWYREDCCFLAV